MSVIARVYSLFLVCCRNSVASLIFLIMMLSSKRKHVSISDLIARARNNASCVLGMIMSDFEYFLMAKSSL